MIDRATRTAIMERTRLFGRRCFGAPLSGRRLITWAALLHVTLAALLFCVGRFQLVPGLVDGDGIVGSFAFDSYEYRQDAVRLVQVMKERGVVAWAAERAPAHVKLISMQFALLGPLLGYTILSAEPLNLFCYVAVLVLVLAIGREVGGRRVGLLAAGTAALLPTFLLHTTQLLKDPLFIAGVLALILATTTWLTLTFSWRSATGMGAVMTITIWLLLLIRVKFALFALALVLFGLALLLVRQLLERRLLYWNLFCPLLILLAVLPFYSPDRITKLKNYPSDQSGRPKSVPGPGTQVPSAIAYGSLAARGSSAASAYVGPLYSTANRVALTADSVRYRFNVSYPESGSGIDREVEFKDFTDLILYLPRAFEIGLWAPFPNTWAGAGRRVGSAGRLMSGAETLLIYLCELLALAGVMLAQHRLAALLLMLISVFGVTVLGLVVSNVGTLYRFRYPFWMLLIILGAKGFEGIMAAVKSRAQGAPDIEGGPEEAT